MGIMSFPPPARNKLQFMLCAPLTKTKINPPDKLRGPDACLLACSLFVGCVVVVVCVWCVVFFLVRRWIGGRRTEGSERREEKTRHPIPFRFSPHIHTSGRTQSASPLFVIYRVHSFPECHYVPWSFRLWVAWLAGWWFSLHARRLACTTTTTNTNTASSPSPVVVFVMGCRRRLVVAGPLPGMTASQFPSPAFLYNGIDRNPPSPPVAFSLSSYKPFPM